MTKAFDAATSARASRKDMLGAAGVAAARARSLKIRLGSFRVAQSTTAKIRPGSPRTRKAERQPYRSVSNPPITMPSNPPIGMPIP